MYLVFLGHALSGGFALAFIYFKNWPSQYLWVLNIYNIFGGYPVVRIAMYGYIGDVTTNRLVLVIIIFQLWKLIIIYFFRQRTTLLSILNGIGKAVFPLADFVMGQLYEVGLKYDVYKDFIFFMKLISKNNV